MPDFCQPTGELALLDDPELFAGQAATFRVGGHFVGCDGGGDVSATVQVALSGPSNEPVSITVSSTSSPWSDPDGGLALAFGSSFTGGTLLVGTVTFTPEAAGRYHLNARFSPNLGSLQLDLATLIDGRGQTQTVPVPGACSWFDLWNGIELCLVFDSGGAGTLYCSYRGEPFAQLPATAVRPAEHALWTLDQYSDSVSLWSIDDDAGAQRRGEARLGLEVFDGGPVMMSFSPTLAADGDQLLMLSGQQVLLARATDAGLVVTDAGQLPVVFSQQSAALLTAGVGAIVGGLPYRGLEMMTTPPTFCLLDFAQGTTTCSVEPLLFGADRRVLWAFDGTSQRFSAFTFDGGINVSRADAWFSQDLPSMFSPGGPAFGDQTQLLFASYGAGLGYPTGIPFDVSAAAVVRIPVLAGGPQLQDLGVWPGAAASSRLASPPFSIGVSEGAVWQLVPGTQNLRYQAR
ncbi:MAG: hypothetical protein QM723_06060 [Myxococcaceae bacterium]